MSLPAAPYHQPATFEEVRTLWIGDLPYWADENYLRGWFSHAGEVLSTKVIRNKITGQPEGYGFVEFASHQVAESILQTYNGTQIPGTEINFRLNWAYSGEKRPDAGPEHSIFVGDLAPDVTDYLLQETFRVNYSSVRGAKVVIDPNTGRSKGYGFVKFADEIERNRAMVEMNGVYCSTRPMRINAAIPKKTTAGVQQPYVAATATYPAAVYTTPVQAVPVDNDLNNATDVTGIGGQPTDPNQLIAYYGYGQGYNAYAYGATQDPTASAYGSYADYVQYPPREGAPDMGAFPGAAPPMEHREEIRDPLSTPDVDRLNAAYLAVHGSAILGRPLWLSTSCLPQQSPTPMNQK